MIRCEKDGIVWLQFPLLLQFPKLKHGVFLRRGGTSEGAFAALNTSFSVGDNGVSVAKNLDLIREVLDLKQLVSGQQVHGAALEEVSLDRAQGKRTCDGLLTKDASLALMVNHADCQAAIFYDPVQHALAAVHSGWRGSCQNIYRKAVEKMKHLFGTRAENLHAAISPSLGPSHAEFVNYRIELPPEFWSFQVKPNYFDFWEITREQLKQCGILRDHIEIASLCTYANPVDYFSYRRDKLTGRHATVAELS